MNIILLHSLNGNTSELIKPIVEDITNELRIDLIYPNFPTRDKHDYNIFKKIMDDLFNKEIINADSIIIAHSISNVDFIKWCSKVKYKPKRYISIAPDSVYYYPPRDHNGNLRSDYLDGVLKKSAIGDGMDANTKNNECIKYLCDNYGEDLMIVIYSTQDNCDNSRFLKFVLETGSKSIYLENYKHFTDKSLICDPKLKDLLYNIITGIEM